MTSPIREELMARAIELSRQGYPAPNPHVGCVLERDGEIVGEAYHALAGGPHAELEALTQAGSRSQGATAYVTLEPCNHQGRTGPCSEALLRAGVARVVFAVPDPIEGHAGGAERLRKGNVDVVEGVLIRQAEEANLPWLTAVRRKSPFVVGKAAMTLDGRIALPNGKSKWITGAESRQQAHRLRALCGAVLVGRATVEHDDPELTVREIEPVNQPVRIVLDLQGKLSPNHRVFSEVAPTLRIVREASRSHDVAAPMSGSALNLPELLKIFYQRGITGLLVEGGAATLSSFLAAGLVDRLELFMAPKLFGDGTSWTSFDAPNEVEEARQWAFTSVQQLGEDLWITAKPCPAQ